MTNDSQLFWDASTAGSEGAYPVERGALETAKTSGCPNAGRMVHPFDHRAAGVVVNLENVHRAAQPEPTTDLEKADADFLPSPQYWVSRSNLPRSLAARWQVAFKDVTAPTNERTMIAAIVPESGAGNTLPLIITGTMPSPAIVSCLNSFAFDFVARGKVQGQHLNWFIVEQLPVVPPAGYVLQVGGTTAAAIVTRRRDFKTFRPEQASAFKADLVKQRNANTGATLSKPTVVSILSALKAFFFWLAGQRGGCGSSTTGLTISMPL